MTEIGVVSTEALETLKKFSSGMIGDALLMAGTEGGILGIHPVRGFEDVKLVAQATTVQFGQPVPGAPKLTMYRAIRTSTPGTVLVIDAQGLGNHFTGDNQGECARRRGLLGTVVYGGARDLEGYRRMGMPLWCMGAGTADKPRGMAVVGHNVPITIGGVGVKPGDIIVADEDGVVAVPQEALGKVLENLKVMIEVEAGMEQAIQGDAPIEEIEAIIAKKKPKS
jgi:4-hydroxy-4-methyl-2-oxoglutarate aldolase